MPRNKQADEVFYEIIEQMRRAGTLNLNHTKITESLERILRRYRENTKEGYEQLLHLLENITYANDYLAQKQVEADASLVSTEDLPDLPVLPDEN